MFPVIMSSIRFNKSWQDLKNDDHNNKIDILENRFGYKWYGFARSRVRNDGSKTGGGGTAVLVNQRTFVSSQINKYEVLIDAYLLRLKVNYLKVTKLQKYKVTKLQGCKVAKMQGCKAAKLQGCKVKKLKSCKVTNLQSCKVAKLQSGKIQSWKAGQLQNYKVAKL